MKNNLPNRKHPRLKEYDYSQNGCYFVTICVKNREPILSTISLSQSNTNKNPNTDENVGRAALSPPPVARIDLSDIGFIADKFINNINTTYKDIAVDKYVIMPDHIHMIVTFYGDVSGGLRAARPTLCDVVRTVKSLITRQLGYSIWQSSFYEHIIRNESEYHQICNYIDNNPAEWIKNDTQEV